MRDLEASGDMPPIFVNHDVRREPNMSETGLDVMLGIIIDGVPSIEGDAAIGFFVINLQTQARYLAVVLRKRGLCQCGCKGWCSFYAALDFLSWSCTAGAQAIWPPRWDGSAWPEDSVCARMEGRYRHASPSLTLVLHRG